MKKILFTIILVVASFSDSSAQEINEEELLKKLIIESFDKIFSEKDINSFSAFYTDDFLLLENGEVWDLKKIADMMQIIKNDNSERLNSFEFIKVKISGETAWIAYHNTAVFKKDGKIVREMNWLESATAIRTPGGWKLDMLHSTRKSVKD